MIKFHKILFLDIETVPGLPSYPELSEKQRKLWDHKASFLSKEEAETPESLYHRAGIYAEFGKVICISCAYMHKDTLRVKSFYGHEEKLLLEDFADMLRKFFPVNEGFLLCAHNGKEFDFPYLARRMVINGVNLPDHLNLFGKKPWEVPHLDTMEMWKFGDYKSYTSLDLLTTVLNVPSPKDDITGADVGRVYWEENNLERIAVYCAKDTVCLAQIVKRFMNLDLIPEENITFA
jgi:3'-5' exonuclease